MCGRRRGRCVGHNTPCLGIYPYCVIYIEISFVPAVHAHGACAPNSCTMISDSTGMRTHVVLDSTSTRDPPYACRGEEMKFSCEVMNRISLQWASEPDIPCNNPLGYTTGDDEGETRTRGSYQSNLTSVIRNSLNSYLSSVLTFTPPRSMNSVAVHCGDQLGHCDSTEGEHTLNITGKCI